MKKYTVEFRSRELSSGEVWSARFEVKRSPFMQWGCESHATILWTNDFDTKMEAEEAARFYGERFESGEFPLTPEQFVEIAYNNHPSLYKMESDVMEHALFVLGNGFDWAFGGIVPRYLSRDSFIVRPEVREEWYRNFYHIIANTPFWKRASELADEIEAGGSPSEIEVEGSASEIVANLRRGVQAHEDWAVERLALERVVDSIPRPFEDHGHHLHCYGVNDMSNLKTVPDDIRDDWLVWVMRAVNLFSVRAADPTHREDVRDVRAELIERFGDRLAELDTTGELLAELPERDIQYYPEYSFNDETLRYEANNGEGWVDALMEVVDKAETLFSEEEE